MSAYLGAPVRLAAARPGAVVYGAPVSLVTTASLRDLAERTGRPALPDEAARFRPSMVVDAGDEAYVEETWLGREVRVGAAVLRVNIAIPRCAVIDLDPRTGERGSGVLKALAGRGVDDHGDPLFGVDAHVVTPGVVRPGDPVEVLGRRRGRSAASGRAGRGPGQHPAPARRGLGEPAGQCRQDLTIAGGERVLPTAEGLQRHRVHQHRRHAGPPVVILRVLVVATCQQSSAELHDVAGVRRLVPEGPQRHRPSPAQGLPDEVVGHVAQQPAARSRPGDGQAGRLRPERLDPPLRVVRHTASATGSGTGRGGISNITPPSIGTIRPSTQSPGCSETALPMLAVRSTSPSARSSQDSRAGVPADEAVAAHRAGCPRGDPVGSGEEVGRRDALQEVPQRPRGRSRKSSR